MLFQDGGGGGGAGPGAAGESFSAAALPHPHFQVVFLQNLHGLQIEPGGPGDFGGGLGQRKMLYVRAEQHPMGIADRKPGQGFPLPPHPGPGKGRGPPHHHGDGLLGAVPQNAQPGCGLDAEGLVAGPATVPGVAGGAPDGVAAHFGLAAIGIKNAHGEIGALGGKEQDQAIAADAEVPVADTAGEQMGVGDGLAAAIDEDVIVAAALHFEKTEHGVASCGIEVE